MPRPHPPSIGKGGGILMEQAVGRGVLCRGTRSRRRGRAGAPMPDCGGPAPVGGRYVGDCCALGHRRVISFHRTILARGKLPP